MVFPNAGPEPRHPSQLYEAVLEGLLLFVVLNVMARRGALKRPGLLTGLFGIGYGLTRSVAEIFREPDGQVAGPITTGMALSIPLVLVGIGARVERATLRAAGLSETALGRVGTRS